MNGLSSLTPVESTALEVSYLRWQAASVVHLPDGSPLYDGSYDGRLVTALMPSTILQEKLQDHGNVMESDKYKDLIYWMGVRTYIIDQEAMEATNSHGIKQVVTLGAGLDLRPWRLEWPAGCTLYEVDTGKADGVKAHIMACQTPGSRITPRIFVHADVTQPESLLLTLEASGLDCQQPVLWILEGLVGYITAADMASLFKGLFEASVAGSRLVMTCPPTVAARDEMTAKGLKLHHLTYEEPEDTLERFESTGWDANLVKLEERVPQLDSQKQWRIIVGSKMPA